MSVPSEFPGWQRSGLIEASIATRPSFFGLTDFRGVNAPASLKLGLAVGIQRQADLFPGCLCPGLIED